MRVTRKDRRLVWISSFWHCRKDEYIGEKKSENQKYDDDPFAEGSWTWEKENGNQCHEGSSANFLLIVDDSLETSIFSSCYCVCVSCFEWWRFLYYLFVSDDRRSSFEARVTLRFFVASLRRIKYDRLDPLSLMISHVLKTDWNALSKKRKIIQGKKADSGDKLLKTMKAPR